jgi:hypothetical protein
MTPRPMRPLRQGDRSDLTAAQGLLKMNLALHQRSFNGCSRSWIPGGGGRRRGPTFAIWPGPARRLADSDVDIRKLPSWLIRGFQGIALVTAAAAIGVHLATYGPDQWGPTLMNFALILFPVVFLVFGPAVIVLTLARVAAERLLAGMPTYVYIIGGIVALYVFVDFFAMMHLLPGQPEQVGSNYYFDNKGDLIPISADAYLMGLMHAARLFSGHEIIFFGVSVLIAHQLVAIREGRINIDAAPRDDAMERSRLPYPLQRVVVLRTTMTPVACAARLLIPQPRAAFSFDASRGLRGEASTEGFRLEIASPQLQMVYALGRFGAGSGETSIRVLLTFKRWPLIFLAASALLVPLVWTVAVGLGGVLPSLGLVAVLVVVVVGGNFLFGLDQRRRLLAQIKRATDAHEVAVQPA